MKSHYIGTQLEPDVYHRFGIRAAQQGKKKSEVIRMLVAKYAALHPAAKKGAEK